MIDQLDVKILNILQDRADLPLNEVADKVGSSRSVVWRRIQRMQDEGVITKNVSLVCPDKVGLAVMVFAHVKMQAHSRENLPNFIDMVQTFPEVVECHTLMGDIDFILKIRVQDVQAYEKFFWDKLSPIEGVREISSSIALTAHKDTTKLSINI
ncbi:Lrp/AsnC family transcriptional regulator [Temperatibacter marinus]|uniref:Lrp/AsnC family transcriptional regulator n=1 Tax=Temperatibacter marinus TaxID=1456591 RepID=A0AA52H881_9PROT|nr:Lrp/AsnC family transcriptional regulator [Temperatibacter marinus]WND01851.1 Lrp/AsnC family transcriptional regulator [Temperatibacter marinus]